jgi:hypothetical protein
VPPPSIVLYREEIIAWNGELVKESIATIPDVVSKKYPHVIRPGRLPILVQSCARAVPVISNDAPSKKNAVLNLFMVKRIPSRYR